MYQIGSYSIVRMHKLRMKSFIETCVGVRTVRTVRMPCDYLIDKLFRCFQIDIDKVKVEGELFKMIFIVNEFVDILESGIFVRD